MKCYVFVPNSRLNDVIAHSPYLYSNKPNGTVAVILASATVEASPWCDVPKSVYNDCEWSPIKPLLDILASFHDKSACLVPGLHVWYQIGLSSTRFVCLVPGVWEWLAMVSVFTNLQLESFTKTLLMRYKIQHKQTLVSIFKMQNPWNAC